MKFNLKNCPALALCSREFKEWFAGFEAELREKEQYMRKGRSLHVAEVIKEILGE